MPNTTRRSLLSSTLLSGGLALSGRSPALAGVTPAGDDMESAREKVQRRYFPDLPLVTHDGKKVRFYDDLIKGKIVTINVMYALCDGVCPGITANLVKVQRMLGNRVGREIFMYSITLKPEHDSPQVLKEYREMYRIRSGWTFLTGQPDHLETLRRSLGFTNPDPKLDQDKSQHIGNIRYGNEPLIFWAACPGMAHPEWIARSLTWVNGVREKQVT